MSNDFNVVVECRDGKFIANKNDMYVGKALIKYGEFSYLEMDAFKKICDPGDVVVEVGANIGSHTVGLAKIVGNEGRVLAIEAQPTIFQNLCGNISINSLTNVDCLNIAVSNRNGSIKIPFYDYSKKGNFGGISMGHSDTGSEVEMKKLDDVFSYNRLKLLKVDVEGMEKEVLEGAVNVIRDFKPILYVENDRVKESKELIEYIFHLGYQLWWHMPPLFNGDNFNGVSENIFENIISLNMMGFHKSIDVNVDLPKVEDSSLHPLQG